MKILKIHTDGGCSNNQKDENIGGWGAVLEYGKNIKEIYGGELNTTNNRMELTAMIEALSSLKRNGLLIEIFSDSDYIVNCFHNEWYKKWEKNGWINTKKEPVANKELWEKLLFLVNNHNVTFYHVKGHVNLNASETELSSLFSKFRKQNGPNFTYEDFIHITKMNIRVDELAQKGISEQDIS